MTIAIQDPGFDWTLLIVFGSIIVGLLAISGLSYLYWTTLAQERYDWPEFVVLGSLIAAGVVAFLGLLIVPGGGIGIYNDRVNEAKVKALEEVGYQDVDLSGDQFTASDDGDYFRGALLPLTPLSWEVVGTTR